MFTIKRMNKISDIIYDRLKEDSFRIGDDGDAYDAIIVRSADLHETVFPDSLLAIARAGAGTNNIPVEDCLNKGIVVFNTPGANANAVRELVICGMLLSGRKVIEAVDWLRQEKEAGTTDLAKAVEKAKNNFVGPEVAGKTIGIIGLGAVGVMVANTASLGFNMHVLGYDPFMTVEAAWHLTRGVSQAASIEEIFHKSDFISLHLPLNKETKGMISDSQIALMKDGVVILNFARGGLVDDQAMMNALRDGKIGHYVTDFPDDVITGYPGVISIPHLGASTPESEENCAIMASRELRDYLLEGNIRNSVNLPDCVIPKNGETRVTVINRNVQNMIGQMTAILAADGINITNLINKSRGEWAYTMFDLESAPTDDVIAKLRSIEGVTRVRVI